MSRVRLFSSWLLSRSLFASYTVAFWIRMKHLRRQKHTKHLHIANNNLTKTLLVVSLLSVTVWLPVSVTLLVRVLCKNCLLLNNSSRAVYPAVILLFRNSLLNLIICNIWISEFRSKLMRLLSRRHSRTSIQLTSLTSDELCQISPHSPLLQY